MTTRQLLTDISGHCAKPTILAWCQNDIWSYQKLGLLNEIDRLITKDVAGMLEYCFMNTYADIPFVDMSNFNENYPN